jgi:aconitate hydratase
MDDHLFLQSAARFGFWFSRPGNGISHGTHGTFWQTWQNTLRFRQPPAGGGMECLLLNGWFRCRLAAAGEPYYVKCQK